MPLINTSIFKNAGWLFPVILITGWIIIFTGKLPVTSYTYGNGRELWTMFIPLLFSIFFLVVLCYFNKPRKWLALLLFVLLVIPFYNVLLNSFQHLVQDDAYRYGVVANNIAVNKTLWGSDDLLFNTDRKVYMIQPGYRYYLAAWLSLFGKENRLFQFFNMGLYLSAVICLLTMVQRIPAGNLFRRGFLLFILLSSAFVTKNIMMGLSDWLVVTVLLFFVYAYLSGKIYGAVLLLALVPFIRQNLLIVALLLFIWLLWQQRQRILYSILFLLVLLLPLYHNLYYAGQWKFFSTYYNTQGFLVLDFKGNMITRLVKTVLYHIVLYAGVDWLLDNFWANVMAVLFVPLGTALYIYGITRLKGNTKWLFLLVTSAAIVPTLIFGGRAYYPRFEWVNLSIALLFFYMLQYKLMNKSFNQRI